MNTKKRDHLTYADSPSDERLLAAIGAAVRAARGDLSQTDLAVRLGLGPEAQSGISKIERGVRELPINLWEMAHIEQACGRPPGFILEHLGYIDDSPLTVRQAIAAHPDLSSEGRAIVLAALDAAEAMSNGGRH